MDTCHKDPLQECYTLQDNINLLVKWTHLNHLAIHPQKTKFMLIATRQKRQNIKLTLPSIYINNNVLEEVSNHKLLGVIIDNNLTWSSHVNRLSKSLASKVYQLNKIKHFLNLQARKMFYYSFIQSAIDYSSTLWDLSSANSLKPLTSIHKRAVKVTANKSISLTSSDYKTFNILPLNSKLLFNKGMLMHKILQVIIHFQ